jgi:hypothetical protein
VTRDQKAGKLAALVACWKVLCASNTRAAVGQRCATMHAVPPPPPCEPVNGGIFGDMWHTIAGGDSSSDSDSDNEGASGRSQQRPQIARLPEQRPLVSYQAPAGVIQQPAPVQYGTPSPFVAPPPQQQQPVRFVPPPAPPQFAARQPMYVQPAPRSRRAGGSGGPDVGNCCHACCQCAEVAFRGLSACTIM